MIDKISFTNNLSTAATPEAQSNIVEEKGFIQKVKEGDKKSIGILAASAAVAAAAIGGVFAFYKSQPSTILKSLDKAVEEGRENGIKTIDSILNDFTKVTGEGDNKTSRTVFELIQEVLDSGKVEDIQLDEVSKIHLSSDKESNKIIAELMEGENILATITNKVEKADDVFSRNAVVDIKAAEKKGDNFTAKFFGNFDGTLKEKQTFSQFLSDLTVEKAPKDNGKTQSRFIYANDGGELKAKQAFKKITSNDGTTKASASIEYNEDGTATVGKSVEIKDDKIEYSENKKYQFKKDEDDNWKAIKNSTEELENKVDEEQQAPKESGDENKLDNDTSIAEEQAPVKEKSETPLKNDEVETSGDEVKTTEKPKDLKDKTPKTGDKGKKGQANKNNGIVSGFVSGIKNVFRKK